jgi:hypothetical protein
MPFLKMNSDKEGLPGHETVQGTKVKNGQRFTGFKAR